MSLWKLVCSFMSVVYLSSAFASPQAPVGRWATMDDKTGKKRAIVVISESNGVLMGTIEKVYPQPGDTGICDRCPGRFKGKKIAGLNFLWGLKNENSNEWDGGFILDPKSGRIYRAKLRVQGDKLLVRGYLGFSLLGRTQVWSR